MSTFDINCKKIEKYFEECFKSVSNNFNIIIDNSLLENLVFCSNAETKLNNGLKYHKFTIHVDGNNYNINLRKFSLKENIGLYSISTSISKHSRFFPNNISTKSPEFDEYVRMITINSNNEILQYVNVIAAKNFSLIKALSNSKYESKNCKANIVILNEKKPTFSLLNIHIDTSNKAKTILFEKTNERIIRKLLEIATDDIAMLICLDDNTDKYYVKGFTCIKGYETKGIQISIFGPHNIKISEKSKDFEFEIEYLNDMFSFKNKDFITKIDKEKIIKYFPSQKLQDAILEFIKDIRKNQNDYHGAIIIFTDDNDFIEHEQSHMRAISPKDENKLNLEDIYTNNKDTFKGLLIKLCNIDGAIVFNNEGYLSLFGSILDGVSKSPGKLERGSRYNSTKTFVEYYSNSDKGKNYLAITMSEDGPINVFTNEVID